MHPIYAMWSHPRSMSTAIERVMRERGDLSCHHEPFMYDYYVNRKVREMPHFEAEKDRPISYEAVRDMLLAEAETAPVFIKDMSYYVMPRIIGDRDFAGHLINCFLIRNPVASILSYFKLDPDVTCEEIGIEAQAAHVAKLQELTGKTPPIILAEDVRVDTRKAMGGLWKAIGLPAADHAFDWQGNTPEEWGQVSGWHGDVSASSGIRPITQGEILEQEQRFAEMAKTHPKMCIYLDHHLPFYEKLKALALPIRQ